jgi:hypothetical protein
MHPTFGGRAPYNHVRLCAGHEYCVIERAFVAVPVGVHEVNQTGMVQAQQQKRHNVHDRKALIEPCEDVSSQRLPFTIAGVPESCMLALLLVPQVCCNFAAVVCGRATDMPHFRCRLAAASHALTSGWLPGCGRMRLTQAPLPIACPVTVSCVPPLPTGIRASKARLDQNI